MWPSQPTFRSLCLACSMSCMEQQWTSCRRCCLLWCSVCSSSSCILRCSRSWLNWCCSCCSDDCDWDSCISRLCFSREIYRRTRNEKKRNDGLRERPKLGQLKNLLRLHFCIYILIKWKASRRCKRSRRKFRLSLGSSIFMQQNNKERAKKGVAITLKQMLPYQDLKPWANKISYCL